MGAKGVSLHVAPRLDLGQEGLWPGMQGQNWGQGDSTSPSAGPSNICNICTSTRRQGCLTKLLLAAWHEQWPEV